MNTDLAAQISLLDLAYQKLSGFKFTAYQQRGVVNWRDDSWHRFIKAGYGVHELEEVILWLKPGIKAGKRNPGCLRFSNLIAQLDRFEEELGMCRAEIRNAKPEPTPKDRVLAQARPVVVKLTGSDISTSARRISEIITNIRKEIDLP